MGSAEFTVIVTAYSRTGARRIAETLREIVCDQAEGDMSTIRVGSVTEVEVTGILPPKLAPKRDTEA